MVRYTDRNKTPLAYHTFFRFVALPLGILVTLGNIFEELGYFKEFQLHPGDLLYALTVIDLIFFLTDLALLVVCVVGLFRWAAYGWYAVMIHLPLTVVYRLYIVIIFYLYDVPDISMAEASLIAVVIFYPLVAVYYFKRKALFFPSAQQPETLPAPEEFSLAQPLQASSPQAAFCRKCGQSLPSGASFCSRCGTPVKIETPPFQ